jgi:hypothetical protein
MSIVVDETSTGVDPINLKEIKERHCVGTCP